MRPLDSDHFAGENKQPQQLMSTIPSGPARHLVHEHELGKQQEERKNEVEPRIEPTEGLNRHRETLISSSPRNHVETTSQSLGIDRESKHLVGNVVSQTLPIENSPSLVPESKAVPLPTIRLTGAGIGRVSDVPQLVKPSADSLPSPRGAATSIARKLRKAASFAGFGAQRESFPRAESEPLLPSEGKRPSTAVNVSPPALENRASVLSTASETPSHLSDQWFQTPQERMGFNVQVKKKGRAPWEKRHRQRQQPQYQKPEQEQLGMTISDIAAPGLKRGWLSFLAVKRRP